jgi:hypothetical protein
MYARACAMRTHLLCEEIIAIADGEESPRDDDSNSSGVWTVEALKLRIDARKWVIARMEPRRHGARDGPASAQPRPHQIAEQFSQRERKSDIHQDDSLAPRGRQ